ncbi:MAG: GNAT family N-acetyltransferase [Anaerolineae bacterium]
MSLTIRLWQPAWEDARAVLQVDGETFRQCPYREEDLVAWAREGKVHVWLGFLGGEPVGYACAFRTEGLEGPRWELDLLAVRPAFRGQGWGRALIRAACQGAPPGAQVRAWVAVGNVASQQAFAAAGFQPLPGSWELWAYAIRGLQPRTPDGAWPRVSPVETPEAAHAWAEGHGGPQEALAARLMRLQAMGVVALIAGREAGVLALPVQTLHYRGLWLEDFWTRGPWRQAVPALLFHAVEWAKGQEMDEVGVMLPAGTPWREALPAQGYGLVAAYREWRSGSRSAP